MLFSLCHFSFVAAASPVGAFADQFPAQVHEQCPNEAGCGDVPWWEAKAPRTCSFTDQFLEFLRQRSQAITAVEQIAQHEQDDIWDDGPPANLPTRSQGDLSALQDRGGECHWRFYRPDPFAVGRSQMLDLHVLADHTLEHVEGRILQHWPGTGLANPLVQWKIVPAHLSINVAIYIPEEVEVFLLEVNIDLQFGHVPILLERQHWDVRRGFFHGYLEPRTTYSVMRGISLMHHDMIGHECNVRPCFASLNGEDLEALDDYELHSGDVVKILAIDSLRETTQVIGHWADFQRGEAHLTQAYSRRVIAEMQNDLVSAAQLRGNAYALQTGMLRTFSSLLALTRGRELRQGTILCIAAASKYADGEIYPVRMTEVEWNDRVSYEFPLLLEALVDANMIDDLWSGSFYETHHTARMITLPLTTHQINQIIVIRVLEAEEHLHVALAEIRMSGPEVVHEMYGDFETIMLYGPSPIDRASLLQRLHLETDCTEENCIVSLNERVLTTSSGWHDFPDGSVVRVLFSPVLEAPQMAESMSVASSTANPDAATTSAEPASAPSAQETASSSGYLPGTLTQTFTTLAWLAWSFVLKIFNWCGDGDTIWQTVKSCTRLTSVGRQTRWSWSLFAILCWSSLQVGQTNEVGVLRFGEALHPGPLCWIGTANPSGVSGKERDLAELPYGVWNIAETHLSGVTQASSLWKIKQAGLEQHRAWQGVPGHPVPLRARSSHAGVWSGVMTISELNTRDIRCNWDRGEHLLGRVQMTLSFYGPFHVTGVNMYGWPRSPTWPNSVKDTNLLFDKIVRELALSRGGPRFIAGDFNHDLQDLRGWAMLQQLGWQDAQALAADRWGQEYFMTFRDSSITDHVLLSPAGADHSGEGSTRMDSVCRS